jgi:hypothetical protein
MMPSETISITQPTPVEEGANGNRVASNGLAENKTSVDASATFPKPLKLEGVLDQFKQFDVTPVIGREFPEAQLRDWMTAENSDKLLRDLAITSESPVLVHF